MEELRPAEERISAHLAARRYREAFEAIVEAYGDKVFRLSISILGDRAVAEEAAQESLLRVWRGLEGFGGRSSVSTWVYVVTRNTCYSIRRSMPEAPAPLDAARVAGAPLETRSLDAEALVAQLPVKLREVVRLFYMEDRSYEEMSRMLDLPMGTVKTYLYRARKALVRMAGITIGV